jgi:hypothetical protein
LMIPLKPQMGTTVVSNDKDSNNDSITIKSV